MAQLSANRAKRAEEEKARQERLAADYREKKRKEQYVLDKELVIIQVCFLCFWSLSNALCIKRNCNIGPEGSRRCGQERGS